MRVLFLLFSIFILLPGKPVFAGFVHPGLATQKAQKIHLKAKSPFAYNYAGGICQNPKNTCLSYAAISAYKTSELLYYRGRYYDSCTGSFIQEDPKRDGMNWYQYVGGDPVNRMDPAGYWDFEIREPKYTGSGYAYGKNPVYDTANELKKEYESAQEHLINQIENDPFGKLQNISQKQKNILHDVLDLLKSNQPISVYGKRDVLSEFREKSQARTFNSRITVFPRGLNDQNIPIGQPASKVLFHESIHSLQHSGKLPIEDPEVVPSPLTTNGILNKTIEPGPKAYEQELWFFGACGISP